MYECGANHTFREICKAMPIARLHDDAVLATAKYAAGRQLTPRDYSALQNEALSRQEGDPARTFAERIMSGVPVTPEAIAQAREIFNRDHSRTLDSIDALTRPSTTLSLIR